MRAHYSRGTILRISCKRFLSISFLLTLATQTHACTHCWLGIFSLFGGTQFSFSIPASKWLLPDPFSHLIMNTLGNPRTDPPKSRANGFHHLQTSSNTHTPRYLYDLDLKCSHKRSRVEGLNPKTAEFPGEAFGRWLDHEGSDPTGGLIHRWIHCLLGFGQVIEA